MLRYEQSDRLKRTGSETSSIIFTGELQKGVPVYTKLNSGVMFHSQDPRGS